jgi:hypothetical protein
LPTLPLLHYAGASFVPMISLGCFDGRLFPGALALGLLPLQAAAQGRDSFADVQGGHFPGRPGKGPAETGLHRAPGGLRGLRFSGQMPVQGHLRTRSPGGRS